MITWKPISIGWAGYDKTIHPAWNDQRVAIVEVLPRWNQPNFAACVNVRPNHVWEHFETEAEAKAYCEALYALEKSS